MASDAKQVHWLSREINVDNELMLAILNSWIQGRKLESCRNVKWKFLSRLWEEMHLMSTAVNCFSCREDHFQNLLPIELILTLARSSGIKIKGLSWFNSWGKSKIMQVHRNSHLKWFLINLISSRKIQIV